MTQSDLLWIVPKWPWPPQDGARQATCNLLKELSAQARQVSIDLLAVVDADQVADVQELKDQLGVRNVYVVRKRRIVSRLGKLFDLAMNQIFFPWRPLTMRAFAARPVATAIDRVIESVQPHTIVYDGLHTAIHASRFGKFRRASCPARLIYRAHNNEGRLWISKARIERGLAKAFFHFQARQVARFEQSFVSACDALAPVSETDLGAFLGTNPTLEARVVPIGYRFSKQVRPSPQQKISLLFVGRLDWHPNREGLTWFLENVWGRVVRERDDIEFHIVGSGQAGWLRPFLPMPRLRFYGRVENLDALYHSATAVVVPIFYGSGTRVKVIEASQFGRPCISTQLGVEGIGLQPDLDYFQAETAEQWCDLLIHFDARRAERVGRNAYSKLRESFDSARSAEAFRQLAYPAHAVGESL